jgi:Putative rRNA methylase
MAIVIPALVASLFLLFVFMDMSSPSFAWSTAIQTCRQRAAGRRQQVTTTTFTWTGRYSGKWSSLCRSSSLTNDHRTMLFRLYGKDKPDRDDDTRDDDDDASSNSRRRQFQRTSQEIVGSILSMTSQRLQSIDSSSAAAAAPSSNISSSDSPPRQQQQQQQQQKIRDLLQRSVQRAYSTTQLVVEEQIQEEDMSSANNKCTISNNDDGDNHQPPPPPPGSQTEDDDDSNIIMMDDVIMDDEMPTLASSSSLLFPHATRYKHHPALTNVALAHALWASILRPNVDTVIDATCGNGYDSVKIAELLFRPTTTTNNNIQQEDEEDDDDTCYSHLLCVDIQQAACDNTQRALVNYLQNNHRSKYQDRIHVLHASHEILPRLPPTNNNNNNNNTTTTSDIGLVVYNLGWLPANNNNIGKNNNDNNNNNGKDCVTTMETTLASIADAALLVRVGGMISVVTYPATGPDEDVAVRLFLECLALLSSNTRTWQEAVESFATSSTSTTSPLPNDDIIIKIANLVTQAMQRVVVAQYGNHNPTTWRVSQHEKLGMDRAPILVTATRIK